MQLKLTKKLTRICYIFKVRYKLMIIDMKMIINISNEYILLADIFLMRKPIFIIYKRIIMFITIFKQVVRYHLFAHIWTVLSFAIKHK